MLFISTLLAFSVYHAISSVAFSVLPVLNSMSSMGMSVAKEKMLSTADRMLKIIDSTRYLRYGGMNRRSTFRNSFIFIYGYNPRMRCKGKEKTGNNELNCVKNFCVLRK